MALIVKSPILRPLIVKVPIVKALIVNTPSPIVYPLMLVRY
jgi:hypothetical protein